MCFVKLHLKGSIGWTDGRRQEETGRGSERSPVRFREDASKLSRHNSNLLLCDSPVASDDVTPELCRLPAQPAGLRDVGNTREHCCKTLLVRPTNSARRFPYDSPSLLTTSPLCSLRTRGLRQVTVKAIASVTAHLRRRRS